MKRNGTMLITMMRPAFWLPVTCFTTASMAAAFPAASILP